MSEVEVPGFRFSGFYYPEILQDLLVWMRANVPEITDEDPHEPFIQLLRAYALVGHLNNVLLDHVALETLLPTARLRESVRAHLALIGYKLSQPSPAAVDVLLTLASVPAVATSLPARALFATVETASAPELVFETQAETPIEASNVLSAAFEDDGGVFVDRLAVLNAGGPVFTPWGGVPQAGDALYFGHETTLWAKLKLDLNANGAIWGANDHVWEYYDGQLNDASPTAVADQGGGVLRVTLTSLLGANNRTGTTVRVRSQLTGQYQDGASSWDGAVNYIDVGYLGQIAPSIVASDYVIGTAWKEPADVKETSDNPGKTVEWTVPESTARRWQKTTVNGVEAYWLRLRIINAVAASPDVLRAQIDQGKQYVKVAATQGRTARDVFAGASTGLADQTFTTSRPDVIQGTPRVYVDEGGGLVEYVVVDDFLSSTSLSRVCTIDFDADGAAIATFGDGTNGFIPPPGADVEIQYRHGAKDDGNVGAGEVTVNRTGFSLAASVTNPRPASGWKAADGADRADLERVKVAGPAAALRLLKRALTADDAELLAPEFVSSDGLKPIARVAAIEGGLGPKTIRMIVVGTNGGAIAAEYLSELDEYFNGDPLTGKSGVLVMNNEATSENFSPLPIAVTANVTGGSKAKIEAALKTFLHPLALDSPGEYLHDFGGTVYRAAIIAAIFAADPGQVRNVVLVAPGGDVALADNELPSAGAIVVNIV